VSLPVPVIRAVLLAIALLSLGGSALAASTVEGPPAAGADPEGSEAPAVTNVLLVHMSPRGSPGLLALENAFRKTLGGAVTGSVSFYSEHFEHASRTTRPSSERSPVTCARSTAG
jgi:hypothetical protein